MRAAASTARRCGAVERGATRVSRAQGVCSARRAARTSSPCVSRCGGPCRARCRRKTCRPRAPARTRRTAPGSMADRSGFRPPLATRCRPARAPRSGRAATTTASLRPHPAAACRRHSATPAASARRARPRHRQLPRPAPWRAGARATASAPRRAGQQLRLDAGTCRPESARAVAPRAYDLAICSPRRFATSTARWSARRSGSSEPTEGPLPLACSLPRSDRNHASDATRR